MCVGLNEQGVVNYLFCIIEIPDKIKDFKVDNCDKELLLGHKAIFIELSSEEGDKDI
jgi:hypothetical protein